MLLKFNAIDHSNRICVICVFSIDEKCYESYGRTSGLLPAQHVSGRVCHRLFSCDKRADL